MRVRVSSSQIPTSMSTATTIISARVAGNGEHTTRTAASAARQAPSGAAPQTKRMPSTEWLISVKAGPRSTSGGRKSTAGRPQMSCTTSRRMYDRPKVTSSSGTCPNLCTLRRLYFSNSAPRMATRMGDSTSAGQKPMTPASV